MSSSSESQLRAVRPGLRVLVVEDHRPAAASMEQFLKLAGHDVSVALTGQAALAAIASDRPDVVLLDIGLPGQMNGYAVARWIGEQPSNRRPLLVAVTGLDGEEDRRQSFAAGIDLHLTKPVDARMLQALLERFQRVVAV